MSTIHAMLDIETTGVNPGCEVLSWGLVLFTSQGIEKTASGYISRSDSAAHGLLPEEDTFKWWQQQSPEAKEIFTKANYLGKSLKETAEELAWTLKDFTPKSTVWANGANFDFPILRAALRASGNVPPWSFRQERCYRTLIKTAAHNCTHKPELAHDARSDAIAQTKNLLDVLFDTHEYISLK